MLGTRRPRYRRYRPDAETGTSPFINFLDAYGTCAEEYPREQRTYVYLEGRPIAIAHATLASSGASAPTAGATYWLHSDHLGTPVLVTNASRVERWRWENDPFGRSKPVEYTVSSQDVSPDDDSSSARGPERRPAALTSRRAGDPWPSWTRPRS